MVDCKEVCFNAIKSVLYLAVLLYPLLTHGIVNDGRDCFWEVVDILTLFDLNVKQCVS
jgi:hypothetical protein